MRLLILSVFIFFALASAKLSKDDCTCRPRVRGKIIGGKVGNQTENQHLVGILSADFERHNFTVCAGTILNEYFILTAGSCVPKPNDRDSIGQMRIRLNEVKRLFTVSKVIVPKEFKRSRFEADHDIALIKLKEKLNFKNMKTIQPACLDAVTNNFTSTSDLLFAGFGSSNVVKINNTSGEIRGFMPAKRLKEGVVQDFTKQDPFCKGKEDRSMCVGTKAPGGDAFCLGDSGSGLFHMRNGRKLLVAVASMPTPEIPKKNARNSEIVTLCTNGTRAARISKYIRWIQSNISKDHCSA